MAVTLTFTAVFGVVAGYGHENNISTPGALAKVAAAWQAAMMEEIQKKDGLLVTAVLTPARVVYAPEHGCPKDGEIAVQAHGAANPAFVKDMTAWRQAVQNVVRNTKSLLEQSRVQLYFQEIETFVYFEPDQARQWKEQITWGVSDALLSSGG